ncbi:TPA: hypothetical protein ACH3X3_009088 [Trebouxia sp. C0006]
MPLEADLTPLVETWSVAEALLGPASESYSTSRRAGTSSKAILARARDTWGPGMITGSEGYEVTEESPVLVSDQYEYQLASASSGRGQDVRSLTQDLVSDVC